MQTKMETQRIIEVAVIVLLMLLLLYSLYSVISPFLGVFAYVAILSVPLNGPFEKLVKIAGNRRKLAGFIYVIIGLAVFVVPFVFIISALADRVNVMIHWFESVQQTGVPELPAWLVNIPLIGERAQIFWNDLQADPATELTKYEPQMRTTLTAFLSKGAGLIGAVLELVLAIIISSVVLIHKSKVMLPLTIMMDKLFGNKNGKLILDATGSAINGVTVGALGTAIICAVFSWIGYAIIGLKIAVVLAAVTFVLVLIQIGPLLVWLPVTIYVASLGNTGNTVFIALYGIVLLGIDNILKPILIGRSGKMPVLVLFLGVVGGMLMWGFTGMFKGAIILAVFYTIITQYLKETDTVISD